MTPKPLPKNEINSDNTGKDYGNTNGSFTLFGLQIEPTHRFRD
jgi:hypothetical protein